MSEDEVNELLNCKFFKPHKLTINTDKPQDCDEEAELGYQMKTLIFKTANEFLNTQKTFNLNTEEEILKKQLFGDDPITKLMWKIYCVGVLNGVTDYANTLITTIERLPRE